MKNYSVIIIRDTDPNFKLEDTKSKVNNSYVHFESLDINEGITIFNKLEVECSLVIISNKIVANPIYIEVATKQLTSETPNLLTTKINNHSVLKEFDNTVLEGEKEIRAFI